MSRDWTPEELQKASETMKAAGHMSYEEFCEYLDDREAHAALSRFANVYVCDKCGMAEALLSYTGTPPRLRNWAIIEAVKELFFEE